MNLQLHDILANPALLKEVPEDTLQKWMQEYPYVSLFHLYSLKRKPKYEEKELHKAAFYFYNREKLYYLLNDRKNDEIVDKTNFNKEVEYSNFEPLETTLIPLENTIKDAEAGNPLEIKIDSIPEDATVLKEEIIIEEDVNVAQVFQPINKTIEDETAIVIKEESTETNDIKPLSFADTVLLEIQQLKEERSKKETAEKENISSNLSVPIIEPTIETKNVEIKIEKDSTENKASSDKEETISNQFTEIYPQPLLVTIQTHDLHAVKTYEEKPTIIEDKLNTEIINHDSLISNKSTLYIPNVDENKIEEPVVGKEGKIEGTIQLATKTIAYSKNEPHTFLEWLKVLDGNLQIQTTETTIENENWIEIPRYEVEQAIANKKEIQQEEQKLFVPNFEEGEVDLFNEINDELSRVASESVSFKQDMMTETLAKIYLKQGKNDKALEIYNELRLKNPKKSTYFASLIKKIDKEK